MEVIDHLAPKCGLGIPAEASGKRRRDDPSQIGRLSWFTLLSSLNGNMLQHSPLAQEAAANPLWIEGSSLQDPDMFF